MVHSVNVSPHDWLGVVIQVVIDCIRKLGLYWLFIHNIPGEAYMLARDS